MGSDSDASISLQWNPTSGSETASGNFDCNICLDFARDPVVTLCGHLYCWPCIYKWLLVQATSLASGKSSQCPICKAGISHASMVPLYGRSGADAKTACRDRTLPPRPLVNDSSAADSTSYNNNYNWSLWLGSREEMEMDKYLNRISIFIVCCIILCLFMF